MDYEFSKQWQNVAHHFHDKSETQPLLSVADIRSSYHFYTGPGDLSPAEAFWRDLYLVLEHHGYLLRPRYNPEWVPSWRGTNNWWYACEDGQSLRWQSVIDATRVVDGRRVMLKRIRLSVSPQEIELAQSLSTHPNPAHRNTHPGVLEVIRVNEHLAIMVMPYLLELDAPEFDTIGEVVEMLRQVFEGLRFTHSQGVAHRNIQWHHILMDASHLYPEAFHPAFPALAPDCIDDSHPTTRTDSPVRYYLVDFSQAQSYPVVPVPGASGVLDFAVWDGQRTVPEYWNGNLCDPFAMDVYSLGVVIRDFFAHGYKRQGGKQGFDFLNDLVQDMTRSDPKLRPAMTEVVSRFAQITQNLSEWKLRSRVASKGENMLLGMVRTGFHWLRQLRRIMRGVPARPVPF